MTGHSPRRLLLRPPLRGRLIIGILLGAGTGVVAWYFGMDVAHAVALGLVVTVVAAVLAAVPEHRPADWVRERAPIESGIRRDVNHLSWSLHSRSGAVAASALRRVRDLARSILARHELDLDEPADAAAIERLLGREAWNTIRPGERPLPQLTAVEATLASLRGLDVRTPETATRTEEPR